MQRLLAAIALLCVTACSSHSLPARWREFEVIAPHNLVRIEPGTDEHGLYAEYKDIPRDVLFERVTDSLTDQGYAKVGKAFDGLVVGYAKGSNQLAVKIEQFEGRLYLAIFDEKGKEPLLHGVVFGKYQASPVRSESEAVEE